MSTLDDLNESINLNRLKDACHVTIRNAFFANYVAALLFLKLQDLRGLMIINDHHHSALTKFSSNMSDLNFWARALFYANDSDVKNRMEPGEAAILSKIASKISSARIQKIMKVPLTAPDAVNWIETIGTMVILKQAFGLKSSYFNHILQTLYHWDASNIGAKQKAINDALMFLMQSDPTSAIIPHMRKLSTTIMTQRVGSIAQRVVGFMKLREDEGGGGGDSTSTGNIASGGGNAILSPDGNGSNASSQKPQQDMQSVLGGLYKLVKMSPNQVTKKGRFTIRNGKLIKKRVKEFAPKKFKAPEFLKPKKQNKNQESELKMKENPDDAT